MFEFRRFFIPTNILVIGAGGTGSRLMPGLAQLVRNSIRKYNPLALKEVINIYLIDDDVVEEKNLARQLFIPQDVGKNKAEVIAQRYATGFGVNITPIPTRWDINTTAFQVFDQIVPLSKLLEASIIIFAVDTVKARKEILKSITANSTDRREIFIIDAGNEDNFGQVKIFTLDTILKSRVSGLVIPSRFPGTYSIDVLPYNPYSYHTLGESAQERSCEALPQTLAINQMMATGILMFAQNLIMSKPFSYNCIRVDLKNGMYTEAITAASLIQKAVTRDELQEVHEYPMRNPDLGFLTRAIETAKATLEGMGMEVGPDGQVKFKAPPAPTLSAAVPLTPSAEASASPPPAKRSKTNRTAATPEEDVAQTPVFVPPPLVPVR